MSEHTFNLVLSRLLDSKLPLPPRGATSQQCYACAMGDENDKLVPRDYVIESIKAEIELSIPTRRQRIFEAIALAALGSIPWVGGVIAAASSAASRYRDGESQSQRDDLLKEWLLEHQEKLQRRHIPPQEELASGRGLEPAERLGGAFRCVDRHLSPTVLRLLRVVRQAALCVLRHEE